eukprot:4363953-Alexandrium_andersonii.AAC.1
MGGQVTATGTPTPEVDSRASACVSAMGIIRQGVLAQPQIPQHHRVSLYDPSRSRNSCSMPRSGGFSRRSIWPGCSPLT